MSPDIAAPLLLHFILFVPLMNMCLLSRYLITTATPFQSTCTPSWVCVYSPYITTFHLCSFISIYMHLARGYGFTPQTLLDLSPFILIHMYPLMCMSLLSRHYITSASPLRSIYSRDITSPLLLHFNLYAPLLDTGVLSWYSFTTAPPFHSNLYVPPYEHGILSSD